MSATPLQPSPGAPTTASGPGGSIYDLGYQSYQGPRLGRGSVVRALFAHSMRSCFGIGRGGRAKIAPFTFAALATLPAVLAVGIAALVAQAGAAGGQLAEASPIRYETYYGIVSLFIMLFCAAQAPELFGRDQRYNVLPLYFSRVLTRSDYALSKVGGLMASLFLVAIVPYLVMFVGRVFVAPDPATGLTEEIAAVPRFVLQALLLAGLFGGLSSLIAAWTPRRAYATAGIIAIFIIPPVVVALLVGGMFANDDLARFAILLSPGDVLDGTNAAIFGVIAAESQISRVDLPGWAYIVAALVGIVGSIGLTLRRYLRIAA